MHTNSFIPNDPARGAARRSFTALEVVIALGLGLILFGLGVQAVVQYAQARREYDTRRALQRAAATELARIRAGIHAPGWPDTAEPDSPYGRIVVRTSTTPGRGEWEGLTRVRVVAHRQINARRRAEYDLFGYVDLPGAAAATVPAATAPAAESMSESAPLPEPELESGEGGR